MESAYRPGLEGVVAAETRLSRIDGEAGSLEIAGFPVEALAPRACFEEVAHVLWTLRLPAAEELAELAADLATHRELQPAALELLAEAARHRTAPIDALRLAAAALALAPVAEETPEEEARRLVGALPSAVAAHWRLYQGCEPVSPRPDLSAAAHFLYLLEGEPPSAVRARALETYWNTVVDHGMNASTFTARVIASTRSDLTSAVVGALGALKGPLHGGAPGPALETVFEIARPERAEPVLRAKLDRGERLMGFGHRVYRVRDPRAEVLSEAAAELYREDGDRELYELTLEVERVALRLLRERKPDRPLHANVELYTALLLHGIGLPVDLFTPVFALARVVGWTAHALEQRATGRLLRPRAAFVGERGRPWVPLGSRGAPVAARPPAG